MGSFTHKCFSMIWDDIGNDDRGISSPKVPGSYGISVGISTIKHPVGPTEMLRIWWENMGVSINGGTQNGGFIGEYPI